MPLRSLVPRATEEMEADFDREIRAHPCVSSECEGVEAALPGHRRVARPGTRLCQSCLALLRIAQELEAGAPSVRLARIKARLH